MSKEIQAKIYAVNDNDTGDRWLDRPMLMLEFELDGKIIRTPLDINKELRNTIWWVLAGKPKLPSFGKN